MIASLSQGQIDDILKINNIKQMRESSLSYVMGLNIHLTKQKIPWFNVPIMRQNTNLNTGKTKGSNCLNLIFFPKRTGKRISNHNESNLEWKEK